MKNGFIYPITNMLVMLLRQLNFVEYVKKVFSWVVSKYRRRALSEDETISVKNFAIDCFMIAKWLFVILAIIFGFSAKWIELVIWYLIASNLFTYFYYHVWGSGFALRDDVDSQRRRYVNFLLSLGFYIVCYTYLYQFRYALEIGWPGDVVDTVNAVYLSVANAFTLTYGGFLPLSQTARVLFATELINTFFFFTIIIVNSVPSVRNSEK